MAKAKGKSGKGAKKKGGKGNAKGKGGKKKSDKKKEKKVKVVKKEVRKISAEEVKGIIRVCGQEVNGSLPIYRSILGIKGVGRKYAHSVSVAIENHMKIDPWSKPLGDLDEKDIETVEDIITNPVKYNIPSWMVNRRRDIESNQNRHLVGNDLTFSVHSDIEREKSARSWVGYRHTYGKRKVRGQRTRSRGRRGGVVGVVKRKGAKSGK